MSARKAVEDVLTPAMTRALWSSDYRPALPVSVQGFDLSAVLPAVFYMFRFGRRRGQGKFVEAFGRASGTASQRRRSVTVSAIAERLADDPGGMLRNFEGKASQAILGDLLLCYCLDNARYALGRDKQVQRIAPTHYMSSWIDLPHTVSHLRHVPEMIVALLANQPRVAYVGQTPDSKRGKTWFPVGGDIRDNVLLMPFAQGMWQEGPIADNYAADRFDEGPRSVGIDQLLMVRLAKSLDSAPSKLKGKSEIPNIRCIASRASRHISEDLRRYLRAYANRMPRQLLVDALECCVALGLTSMVSSVIRVMNSWAGSGRIDGDKGPGELFVDCSAGADAKLRALAEISMDEHMRRARRLPVHFMALRILDYKVRTDIKLKKKINVRDLTEAPQADEWLTLLGDLLHGRNERSQIIMQILDEQASALASGVERDYPDVAQLLTDDDVLPNPVWRLAEGLVALRGNRAQNDLASLIDSSLMVDRPNGLARKRRGQRTIAGARKTVVLRSAVFTDTALEYLVHLLLLKPGNAMAVRSWFSFDNFIGEVRYRYGFYVDRSPSGMNISNNLLLRNRQFLDRRLRDLGLLASVNDAEPMKRLTPRFEPSEG
ncbi:MAG: hypothetical protein OXN89_07000 [Bryobacterales bacterium]|nr:hypothetical protein [Bryobacterales bacterium]